MFVKTNPNINYERLTREVDALASALEAGPLVRTEKAPAIRSAPARRAGSPANPVRALLWGLLHPGVVLRRAIRAVFTVDALQERVAALEAERSSLGAQLEDLASVLGALRREHARTVRRSEAELAALRERVERAEAGRSSAG